MVTGFLSALFSIVIIDLALAGDNAIVIALAARRVPKHLQQRVIIWGAAGAIAVRTSLTLLVVWLLQIPGLQAAGALVLLWIAYRLLVPKDGHEAGAGSLSAGFWGAMKTIIVADTVMGLDNILAVAGAAQGSFLLVMCGLLISIPIVIWGSTLVLGFVERHPSFVYLGAGVLASTAAKMLASEPLLRGLMLDDPLRALVLHGVFVLGVLYAGVLQNHLRREARISGRLAIHAREKTALLEKKGERNMLKVLVPVDGSPNSLLAVKQVVRDFFNDPGTEVHLLHVEMPMPRHITRFVSRTNLAAWRDEESAKALQPAVALLAQHRIPCITHREKGRKAETIVAAAQRLLCDYIVIGSARRNSFTRMIQSSVTSRVLELTSVPVEVVSGEAVSPLEKYGVPAGIGAVLMLLLAAALD